MGDDMMQIGEVAAETGLSLRTIRHYEEVDLVPPSGRTAGGFRLYTEHDVERLRLVKDMKPLHYTLDEMRQVLDLRTRLAETEPGSTEHERLRDLLAGFAEIADERCQQLRDQVRAAESVTSLLRADAAGLTAERRT